MKLLIVDDEKLTRDGIMNNIDWKELGIDMVCQADDGVHGYEAAQSLHPDILLSDIRMPRMTGIEMAEKLQQQNPDLSIIFMSGYSDKEYLKAAIKLKAVSYVEKPIDLAEIRDTVKEACGEVLKKQKVQSSQELSVAHTIHSLALALTGAAKKEQPPMDFSALPFAFPCSEGTLFFTFLIQFYNNQLTQEALENQVAPCIKGALVSASLEEIHAVRHGHLFIYHIWGFHEFTENQKHYLGQQMEAAMTLLPLKYHIVFGKNVTGVSNIYNSYNSAVITLQNSFFSHENSHLIYKHQEHYDTFLDLSTLNTDTLLSEALLRKDKAAILSLFSDLFEKITTRQDVLPNQVKDLYYKLFTTVRDAYRILQIQTTDTKEPDDSIWGHISECQSYYELHALMLSRIELFFQMASSYVENNSTIYLIKEFIAQNYSNDSLSIKDISEHVFLSSSYICTLFKNETGLTLNQYLTEYRMEKAKKLLVDPRYKITEISSKVGYSDGNYFGKTFKKLIGMSPSEYRDKEQTAT